MWEGDSGSRNGRERLVVTIQTSITQSFQEGITEQDEEPYAFDTTLLHPNACPKWQTAKLCLLFQFLW